MFSILTDIHVRTETHRNYYKFRLYCMMSYWVGISVFYLAYPLRVYDEDMDSVSCFVGHTFVRVGNMMVSPAMHYSLCYYCAHHYQAWQEEAEIVWCSDFYSHFLDVCYIIGSTAIFLWHQS